MGPNRYGVIGRQIRSLAGFSHGASIMAAGADGTVWAKAMLAPCLIDLMALLKEKARLKDKTGDSSAKSKLGFKLTLGGADMAACLA